jgi:branched-chain amino acid aminotransferase
MLVSLNNCLIPEADAAISIADRGFLYGDGLFETVRACDGRLALWEEHARRLFAGVFLP